MTTMNKKHRGTRVLRLHDTQQEKDDAIHVDERNAMAMRHSESEWESFEDDGEG